MRKGVKGARYVIFNATRKQGSKKKGRFKAKKKEGLKQKKRKV
jgi:hypothetical protein